MRNETTGSIQMKRFGTISSISSILALVSYACFTILSYANYPLPYSPINNWLSDLGNKGLNPTGAIFYNIGILVTAVWLLLFFIGFSALKTSRNRIQNLMVLLTQMFGVIGCVSMGLSAFYTIENPGPHSFLSGGLYICLGTAFAFSVAALRYFPKYPKWLLMLGVLTALFDLLISLFFNSGPRVFEWVNVCLFLTYVVLLGASMKTLRTSLLMNTLES